MAAQLAQCLDYGMKDWDSIPVRAVGDFFSTASRPALGSAQPPVQWVTGALFLGVKRLGREADYSPPSIAEVKMCGAISPLP
jgi:hypothetical protein